MKISRLFIYDDYKGTRDYLKIQSRYELTRTLIYFGLSISLFIAGIIATGDRMNLLTVAAVLGCLPSCKSAIDSYMFLRYKGCSSPNADIIDTHMEGLDGLYDRIFTSYSTNFQIAHITVKGNTLCGFTEDAKFDENAFNEHITMLLQKDGFKDISVKVFKDINKYTARLEQLKVLDTSDKNTAGIISTLNNVSL